MTLKGGTRGVKFLGQIPVIIYARTVWVRTTTYGKVTHVGEGRISAGQQRAHPKRGPQRPPNFWTAMHTVWPRPTTSSIRYRVGRTCSKRVRHDLYLKGVGLQYPQHFWHLLPTYVLTVRQAIKFYTLIKLYRRMYKVRPRQYWLFFHTNAVARSLCGS